VGRARGPVILTPFVPTLASRTYAGRRRATRRLNAPGTFQLPNRKAFDVEPQVPIASRMYFVLDLGAEDLLIANGTGMTLPETTVQLGDPEDGQIPAFQAPMY
jgi:hypothetical protein